MDSTTINFLSADLSLGKSFWLDDQGELQKSSYPNVKNFTSHSVPCTSLREFYTQLKEHAAEGHCLIKGKLNRALDNESRAASTKSDDTTSWICLDLDGAPYASPQEFIKSEAALRDVSYVVQYSASYGINGNTKLSCHIFMMLDASVPAAVLKTWLMELNLTNTKTREGIMLTRTGAALHWPVDVTACQNDKLLYIAPPKLGKGVTTTLKDSERIQYVSGKSGTLSAKSIIPKKSIEALKEEERGLRNVLRVEQGLKPLRVAIKWHGDYEVQGKPGEATITGIKEEPEFVRFNLNGGDSWSYYHPVGNFELIHTFKSEPAYYTRELLPAYYKDCVGAQKAKQEQPTETGETILAFRDKRTAQYWNGTWRPESQVLELHPAKSELQLNHWMQNHGMTPFEVIPVWDMQFLPQSDVIIDEENRIINTYVPSPYFNADFNTPTSLDKCPLIKRIMLHAVSGGKEDETFEHWLNWLAVIFQYRVKPKTAWILHGTEGTGKGVVVDKILALLLGRRYVQSKRASELEDKFNGWLEEALIGFIDEIKVSASAKKDTISGDLRNFITEDFVTIRGMQKAAMQRPSYTGLIFSSNENDPVFIKMNDRRYNVGFFQPVRLKLTNAQVNGDGPGSIKSELPLFMNYLMTRVADIDTAATPLLNDAHATLVENNKTSIDVVACQLADGDIPSLWDSVTDPGMAMTLGAENAAFAYEYHKMLKREIVEMCVAPVSAYRDKVLNKKVDKIITNESRLSRDELLIVFEHCVGNMPKTPNKFTSLLKHRNIKTERIRIGGALVHGLRVEWKAPRSWLEERMTEFEAQKPTTKLARVK